MDDLFVPPEGVSSEEWKTFVWALAEGKTFDEAFFVSGLCPKEKYCLSPAFMEKARRVYVRARTPQALEALFRMYNDGHREAVRAVIEMMNKEYWGGAVDDAPFGKKLVYDVVEADESTGDGD
ncbi:MAG: hypothetical protein RMM53_03410 [Bacteroidia bacterium]|nr:hypothetical protein [Bacteroidia bacterium]MDW8333247.1 hypothetical protein [Bacteroidia bacterium]